MKYVSPLFLFLIPVISNAQGLQEYIPSFVNFLSDVIIPFLLGIAFLVVVINTVRFFVFESTNKEGQEKAKGFIIYSIFAFVVIIAFWGIINLLAGATDLDGCRQPTSDYVLDTFVGPPLPDCS